EDVKRRQRRQEKFPELQLTMTDREALCAARGGGRRLSERRWRRIRILELFDRGWKQSQAPTAVGTYQRAVRRGGWRYLERGLDAALSSDHDPSRPSFWMPPSRLRSWRWRAARHPPGHARWTLVLTAQPAHQRGVVRKVGRETIRRLSVSHALKPW